jgi:hypothetical protein
MAGKAYAVTHSDAFTNNICELLKKRKARGLTGR